MKIGKKTTASANYTKGVSTYQKAANIDSRSSVDDSVEVSSSFSLVQKAVEALADVPDIRPAAISGIQQEMANGTYHRDEVKVAERVIEDHMKPSN